MAKRTIVATVQQQGTAEQLVLSFRPWSIGGEIGDGKEKPGGYTIPLDMDDATVAKLLREYASKIVDDSISELEALKRATDKLANATQGKAKK